MRDPRLLFHPITHASSQSSPSLSVPSRGPVAEPARPMPFAAPATSELIVPDVARTIVPDTGRDVREIVPGGYPLWELPLPLRRLCESVEAAAHNGEVPLELLHAELDALEDNLQMLAPWWIFDSCTYRRNLIRRTAEYEMLLLCWQPGQKSPIHDHRGSGCAFRVIEGVVTETIFERGKHANDPVVAASMRWLPVGAVCSSREFDIHEVANTQPRADLVTLHVYSPPLCDVNQYRSADSTPAS